MRVIKNCISFFAPEKLYSPKDVKMINILKWIKNNRKIDSKTLAELYLKKIKMLSFFIKKLINYQILSLLQFQHQSLNAGIIGFLLNQI